MFSPIRRVTNSANLHSAADRPAAAPAGRCGTPRRARAGHGAAVAPPISDPPLAWRASRAAPSAGPSGASVGKRKGRSITVAMIRPQNRLRAPPPVKRDRADRRARVRQRIMAVGNREGDALQHGAADMKRPRRGAAVRQRRVASGSS